MAGSPSSQGGLGRSCTIHTRCGRAPVGAVAELPGAGYLRSIASPVARIVLQLASAHANLGALDVPDRTTIRGVLVSLSLQEAVTIAEGVISWSHTEGTGALTAVVLDTGGHPRVVMRDDGSEFLRVDVALGKAWGALGMGVPSRLLAEKAPHFLDAVAVTSGGRLVPVPGGVIVRRAGDIVGAVGVSGDSAEVDEKAAVHAIEAAGFQADYGQVEEWRRP